VRQNQKVQNTMCVLLVEDEDTIRDILAESLQDAGHEVVTAPNGVTAIDLISQSPESFSVLVTDFHMPGGLNGWHVAQHIRQHRPRIPVVITSGRPDVFDARWREEFGMTLLCKPYLPSQLVVTIARLLREAQAHSS
jgi:CheY-like chemotaxis protein